MLAPTVAQDHHRGLILLAGCSLARPLALQEATCPGLCGDTSLLSRVASSSSAHTTLAAAAAAMNALRYRLGFALRETGQAMERLGATLQGIYSWKEQSESWMCGARGSVWRGSLHLQRLCACCDGARCARCCSRCAALLCCCCCCRPAPPHLAPVITNTTNTTITTTTTTQPTSRSPAAVARAQRGPQAAERRRHELGRAVGAGRRRRHGWRPLLDLVQRDRAR